MAKKKRSKKKTRTPAFLKTTLDALRERLPKLVDLNVRVLWLMPIHPIGQAHRVGELGSSRGRDRARVDRIGYEIHGVARYCSRAHGRVDVGARNRRRVAKDRVSDLVCTARCDRTSRPMRMCMCISASAVPTAS